MILTVYSTLQSKNLALIPVTGDYTVRRGTSSLPHTHNVYHLIFITAGQGTLTKDRLTVELREGDITIINPGEKHIYTSLGETDFVYFSFNFYLLDLAAMGGFSEIEGNLGNLDYYENHSIVEPYSSLFSIAADANGIIFGQKRWHDIIRCLTEVDEYTIRYRAHSPLTREETIHREHDRINFFVRHLLNLHDIFMRAESAGLTQKERRLVLLIIGYLEESYDRPLNLNDMSSQLSYSPVYLCRYFKEKTGYTISDYLNQLRVNKGCEQLTRADLTISQIAEKLGFCSPSHFTKSFKRVIGISPREYRLMKS